MPTAKTLTVNAPYWEDLRIASESIPEVKDLRGKKVFITGATGMLCSAMVDIFLFLNREFDYGMTIFVAGRNSKSAADRFRSFSKADGLVFVNYDATSAQAVDLEQDVDYIIHGASNASPDLYKNKPVETMLANIIGLSKMLDLAEEKSARRLLYVSSSEIYGQKTDSLPFSEEDYGYLDILNERAGYPSSKRAGESLCVAYGMEHGVDAVIVRPGHIYGPSIRDSDNRASAQFTRKALAGEDVVLMSRGTQLRSYCYSLDCASAIVTVLLAGEKSNAYNISNPNSICTVSEIAEEIARAGEVGVKYEDASSTGQVTHSLMENSSLNSDKLEALGWKPAFDLQAGVASMLATLKGTTGEFSL